MKDNAYLVQYARAQVGRPYWWGTFGQTSTAGLLSSKRLAYPSYYASSDYYKQLGVKVHDCIGLIKGGLWCSTPSAEPKYNAAQDLTAAGYYARATEKGQVGTAPKFDGMLVFKGVSPKTIHHVGIYAGGIVIHAKGHAYGVVEEAFNPALWQYWAQCPFTEKAKSQAPAQAHVVDTSGFPTIRVSSFGAWVTLVQQALNAWGFTVEEDGVFGAVTEQKVKSFQHSRGLAVDGVVGPKTWRKLFL